MTGPENLLARWSRRKSDASTREGDAGNAPHDSEACATSGATQPSDVPPPLDLASLPTLNSIGAETDLRAFLGKGVPSELTRAALRRGWSADPAIRDFIGLSENSWNFNDPGAIPGFGALEPEEIQRLLAQLTGGNEMNEGVAPASAAPLRSDQATPQSTECAASSELRQDMPDNDVDSHSTQNAPQDPAPAQIVPAHSVDVATSKVQLARELDVRTPSHRHGHGGARPRFDVT
jgi:Protein of unknown function (DUF3306)